MRRHSYSVVCLFLLLVLLLGTSSSHSLTTTEAAATAGEVEEGPASPLSSSLLYLRRGRGLQQGPLSSVLLTSDWEVEEQKQERILGTNSHPGRGGGKKSKESEDDEDEEKPEEEDVVEQIEEQPNDEEQGAGGTYDETTEGGEASGPGSTTEDNSNNGSGTAGAPVPNSVKTEEDGVKTTEDDEQQELTTTACRAASRGQPITTNNRFTLLYEYELVVDRKQGKNSQKKSGEDSEVLVDGFQISNAVIEYLNEKYLYAYCKQRRRGLLRRLRRSLRFQAGQVRGIHPGTTKVLLPTDGEQSACSIGDDGTETTTTGSECFRLQSTLQIHLDDDYKVNDDDTQDMIQDLADNFATTIIPNAMEGDGDSSIVNGRFVSGQAGSVNVVQPASSASTTTSSNNDKSSSGGGRNALHPAGKAFLTLFILGLCLALALVLWSQYRQNHNRNNKDSRSRDAVADPEKPTGRRREQLEQFRQKTQSKLRDLGQSGKSKIQQGKSKMQDLWDKRPRRNDGNINKAMTPTATFPTDEEEDHEDMMVEDTEFDEDNMMVEVSRRRQHQQEQRGIVVDPDKIVMKAENNSKADEIEDKIRVSDPIETMSMNGFGTEMVWEGGNGDDDDGTATHGDGGSTVVTSKGSHSSSNNDEHNVDNDGSSSKRSMARSFLGLRPPRQMKKGWTPSRQQLKAAVAETPTTGGTTFFTPETLPSLTEKEKPLLLEIGNRPTNSYTTEMESWSLSHVDIIIDDETETISVDDDDAATSTSFPRSYVIPDTVQL